MALIDGRSGSGKTALCAALADAWETRSDLPLAVIHLDDIYPGWNGLDAASAHVHEHLLSRGTPVWRRHDWSSGEPAEWVSVDPDAALIIEGVGSLSQQNRALATLGVWLELDDDTRRTRALERVGATFEPFWDTWARQEEAYIVRESPQGLADVILDLSPGV